MGIRLVWYLERFQWYDLETLDFQLSVFIHPYQVNTRLRIVTRLLYFNRYLCGFHYIPLGLYEGSNVRPISGSSGLPWNLGTFKVPGTLYPGFIFRSVSTVYDLSQNLGKIGHDNNTPPSIRSELANSTA